MKNTTLLKNNQYIIDYINYMHSPISSSMRGADEVVRAWEASVELYNLDVLTFGLSFSVFSRQEDVTEAVRFMRSANIKKFVLADTSTALMEEIHCFIAAGATFEGPEVVKATNRWGEEIEFKGIKFTL